jgi:hypothetical protein
MANFVVGIPQEISQPSIEVTVNAQTPLPVGRHRFQLVVVDDGGNRSLPDTVEVLVKDSTNPTAVLKIPSQVEFGQSFLLDGRASSDVAPGKVVKFIWTMLD